MNSTSVNSVKNNTIQSLVAHFFISSLFMSKLLENISIVSIKALNNLSASNVLEIGSIILYLSIPFYKKLNTVINLNQSDNFLEKGVIIF